MLSYKGESVTRLTLTAEVGEKDNAVVTILLKLYIGRSGEIGRDENHPHPDRLTNLVGYQHELLERAGYVVEEEDEQVSTNGVNHWLLTRSYKLREAINA